MKDRVYFCKFDGNILILGNALKYIKGDDGQKRSVIVPIERWEEINEKYSRLLMKVKVLTDIKKGLDEVEEAKKQGRKLQSLKAFLNEGNR